MKKASTSGNIWRVEVEAPLLAVEAVEAALAPDVETVSSFLADPAGDETAPETLWQVSGHVRREPARAGIEARVALAMAALGRVARRFAS